MKLNIPGAALAAALFLATGCATGSSSGEATTADADQLTGAWRSQISFRGGALAGMKGLEFMYSYNAGGTMTESSNYDEAANSTPPAYGVWKRTGPRTFETKYLFYTTRASTPADSAPTRTDWWPAGHGELTETITLSADGQSSTSTIRLALFDISDAPIAGGGEGTTTGKRITF